MNKYQEAIKVKDVFTPIPDYLYLKEIFPEQFNALSELVDIHTNIEEVFECSLEVLLQIKKQGYVYYKVRSSGIRKVKVVNINLMTNEIVVEYNNGKDDYEDASWLPLSGYNKMWWIEDPRTTERS